jgi:hypothetical protein
VITNHGPLGALYPTNTTHGQKEGDTMTFLSWIPTGMNDPAKPEWGSWAGRYGLNADSDWPNFWANQNDTWHGTTNRDNTLKRWATAIQNDFRARMDWCVKSRAEANHPPQPRLKGQPDSGILFLHPRAGTTVTFDATPTTDPDGNSFEFEWFAYPEAGTFHADIRQSPEDKAMATVDVPPGSIGYAMHIILSVTDAGTPPLTRYRRIVLEPKEGE